MAESQTADKTARYGGLDLLRGLAAFVVVLIHTPVPPSDTVKPVLLDLLPPANAVFALMAGFFMLEGLRKQADLRAWLKSRLHRLVVPYLLWTVAYVLLNLAFDGLSRKASTFAVMDGRGWLNVLLCGGGATHLWFLPTLFYAQILLFLGWKIGRQRLGERASASVAAVVGLCVLCAYPAIGDTFYLRKLAFMVGYVFLGGLMVIGSPWFASQRVRIMAISASVLACMGLLRVLDMGAGVLFIDAVRAVLWVLLARSIWMTNPSRLVSSAGACSMGIYLVHIVFVLGLAILFRKANVLHEGAIQMMAVATAAFVSSGIAVIVLRQWRVPGM